MLILVSLIMAVVVNGVLPPAMPNRSMIVDKHLTKFGMNDEQRLLRYFLREYDISVRPVYNASTVVRVFMGLTLTHIFNIDEKNQVLALNVWVEQGWQDERIAWHPPDFGNIAKLTVPTTYVWTPDIVLYNNARDFSRGFIQTNLHIDYTGAVQWAPPAKIYSICKLDGTTYLTYLMFTFLSVTYFPFDDQFCFLEFGSWIYDSNQLDVEIVDRGEADKTPFTRDSFTENGEWEIVANRTRKLIKKSVGAGEHGAVYPVIVFELHLRRRMLYFLYNIIIPCIMLSILTMMQFWLPCESGEKVTLGLTVLLAYSVFSFNIQESMPETSEVIPLIAIYLMCIMGISATSVCFSVIVLNMRHGGEHQFAVPDWLHCIASRILARLLCISAEHPQPRCDVDTSSHELLSMTTICNSVGGEQQQQQQPRRSLVVAASTSHHHIDDSKVTTTTTASHESGGGVDESSMLHRAGKLVQRIESDQRMDEPRSSMAICLERIRSVLLLSRFSANGRYDNIAARTRAEIQSSIVCWHDAGARRWMK